MALNESDLSELLDTLRAGGNIDVIRRSLELVLQALIESEATELIGADPHERCESRINQRNGHRPQLLSTKAGDVELAIPKLRRGSFFPSVLERRRRIERALFAVVVEAYGTGCRPARSTTWSRPWAWSRASPKARSLASVPTSTWTWPPSAPGR